ncbi:unnamed protein product [Closterium sp. NIES-54]
MASQRQPANDTTNLHEDYPAQPIGSDRSRNNQEALENDENVSSRTNANRRREKESAPLIYDPTKKESAMAACADEHLALLACMRNQSSLALIWGQSEECRAKHAAFWECYGRHRGVRGNRIAAWLARPVLSRDAEEGEKKGEGGGRVDGEGRREREEMTS